jgi:hypothetical protein
MNSVERKLQAANVGEKLVYSLSGLYSQSEILACSQYAQNILRQSSVEVEVTVKNGTTNITLHVCGTQLSISPPPRNFFVYAQSRVLCRHHLTGLKLQALSQSNNAKELHLYRSIVNLVTLSSICVKPMQLVASDSILLVGKNDSDLAREMVTETETETAGQNMALDVSVIATNNNKTLTIQSSTLEESDVNTALSGFDRSRETPVSSKSTPKVLIDLTCDTSESKSSASCKSPSIVSLQSLLPPTPPPPPPPPPPVKTNRQPAPVVILRRPPPRTATVTPCQSQGVELLSLLADMCEQELAALVRTNSDGTVNRSDPVGLCGDGDACSVVSWDSVCSVVVGEESK